MDNSSNSSDPFPWYKDGLRFQCTECGKCCKGAPGYVWIDEKEMAAMAEFLNISLVLFKRRYVRKINRYYALVEKKSKENSEERDCVFLKAKKCQVYQVRPKQCQTFPWWGENLSSPQSWQAAASECEGINSQAPVVPYEQIIQLLRSNDPYFQE